MKLFNKIYIFTCPSCHEGKFTINQKLNISYVNPLYCNHCGKKVKEHSVLHSLGIVLFQSTFVGLMVWNIFFFSLTSITASIFLFGLTLVLSEVFVPLVEDKNSPGSNYFFYFFCVLITLLFFIGIYQTIFGHEFAPMVVISVIGSIALTSTGYSKLLQSRRARDPYKQFKFFTIIAFIPFACFLLSLLTIISYSLFDSQPLMNYLSKNFPSLGF